MLISSEGSTRDKWGHCCAISTKSRGEWSSPEEMHKKNGLYRLNDTLLCFMDFLWVIENADGYKNVLREFDKVNTNHRTRQEQKIPATANTLCMGNLYIQRNVCIWPIPKAANTPNTYTTFMKTRAIYIDPFFFLFFYSWFWRITFRLSWIAIYAKQRQRKFKGNKSENATPFPNNLACMGTRPSIHPKIFLSLRRAGKGLGIGGKLAASGYL